MTIRSARSWALLAVTAVTATSADAQVTVGTTTPGVGTLIPFGGDVSMVRYQQAYDAGQFAGPITIGAITFHNTQFVIPGSALAPAAYSFLLSTTSRPATGLGGTPLAGNVTGSQHTFRTITLGGVAAAALTITGTPYSYDPSAGNLLLDVLVTPFGPIDNPTMFDGDFSNDVMSAAYEFQFPGEPLSPAVPAVALITTFDVAAVSAVPEPSTATLAAVGMLALAGGVRARRRVAAR